VDQRIPAFHQRPTIGTTGSLFEVTVFHPSGVVGANLSRFSHTTTLIELPLVLEEARRRVIDRQLDLVIFPDAARHPFVYLLGAVKLGTVQVGTWVHAPVAAWPSFDFIVTMAAQSRVIPTQRHVNTLVVERIRNLTAVPAYAASLNEELGFFFLGSLFSNPLYLVRQVWDSNDSKSTLFLPTVLAPRICSHPLCLCHALG
jgi:hypothetical protein